MCGGRKFSVRKWIRRILLYTKDFIIKIILLLQRICNYKYIVYANKLILIIWQSLTKWKDSITAMSWGLSPKKTFYFLLVSCFSCPPPSNVLINITTCIPFNLLHRILILFVSVMFNDQQLTSAIYFCYRSFLIRFPRRKFYCPNFVCKISAVNALLWKYTYQSTKNWKFSSD